MKKKKRGPPGVKLKPGILKTDQREHEDQFKPNNAPDNSTNLGMGPNIGQGDSNGPNHASQTTFTGEPIDAGLSCPTEDFPISKPMDEGRKVTPNIAVNLEKIKIHQQTYTYCQPIDINERNLVLFHIAVCRPVADYIQRNACFCVIPHAINFTAPIIDILSGPREQENVQKILLRQNAINNIIAYAMTTFNVQIANDFQSEPTVPTVDSYFETDTDSAISTSPSQVSIQSVDHPRCRQQSNSKEDDPVKTVNLPLPNIISKKKKPKKGHAATRSSDNEPNQISIHSVSSSNLMPTTKIDRCDKSHVYSVTEDGSPIRIKSNSPESTQSNRPPTKTYSEEKPKEIEIHPSPATNIDNHADKSNWAFVKVIAK